MSTKSTLLSFDDVHLYRDAWDDDVYLEMPCIFDANNSGVTIRIPVDVWEAIRRVPAFHPQYLELSDQQIQKLVEDDVDQRIREYTETDNDKLKYFLATRGRTRYGKITDSRELQIEMGIASTKEQRLDEQEIKAKIDAHLAKFDG